MANENDAVDNEPLSIEEALRELWERANPHLTTSQRIQAIDPETADKYRQLRKIDSRVAKLEKDNAAQKGWMKRIGGLFNKAGE